MPIPICPTPANRTITRRMEATVSQNMYFLNMPVTLHRKLQYHTVSTYDSLGHHLEDDWFDGKERPKFKDIYTNYPTGNAKDILRKYPDGHSEYVMQDGKQIFDSDKK